MPYDNSDPNAKEEYDASGLFDFEEEITTRKNDVDSFSMDFVESESSFKVGDSSSTDAWVWLTSFLDKTLSTSTVDPSSLSNGTGVNISTISHGNNPITTWNETAVDFTAEWKPNDYIGFKAKPYNNVKGINVKYSSNEPKVYNSTNQSVSSTCYGVDLLIAVNHAQHLAYVFFYPIYNKTGSNNIVRIGGDLMTYVAIKKYL